MSAIAGVFHRDGRASCAADLAVMTRGLAHWGNDAPVFAASGPVAMSYVPFHVQRLPSSASPAKFSDGTLVAVNGRLDNATQIRQALVSARRPSDDIASLFVSVHRDRGLAGFATCIGDFAVALWVPAQQSLILCCDGLGRRPLFYRISGGTLMWASSPRALAESVGVTSKLDEQYLAEFLSNRRPTRSPFAEICQLSGGQAIVATSTTIQIVRYWSFDPNRTVRHNDDRDYEHEFADLFNVSVACRMASDRPVFAELSGGLDSSAVSSVAHNLIACDKVPAPSLSTISYVYDRSQTADERHYMRIVEAHIGQQTIEVLESEHPFLTEIPQTMRPDWPSNELWAVGQNDQVVKHMNAVGARVLLSGVGGDQVFWSEPDVSLLLADFITDRQWGRFAGELATWSRVVKRPATQLVRSAFDYALRRRRRATVVTPRWLNRGFVERTDLSRLLRRLTAEADAFRLPTAALQCQAILGAMRPFALESCSSIGYVDRRYPFLDRRLAEYALAIPVEQKLRITESRSILRRGLKGVVPDAILQRRSKAGPGEAFIRALIRARGRIQAMLREPRVSDIGLVERTALQSAVTRAIHGDSSDQLFLARTLALELWLRTFDSRVVTSTAAAPPGWREPRQQGDEDGTEEHGTDGAAGRLIRSA